MMKNIQENPVSAPSRKGYRFRAKKERNQKMRKPPQTWRQKKESYEKRTQQQKPYCVDNKVLDRCILSDRSPVEDFVIGWSSERKEKRIQEREKRIQEIKLENLRLRQWIANVNYRYPLVASSSRFWPDDSDTDSETESDTDENHINKPRSTYVSRFASSPRG